jgi:hypothetical protein
MRTQTVATAAALVLAGGLAAPGFASQAASTGGGSRIDTTVTIRTENGDFWGQVKSPRPRICAAGRKVVLFKQVGRNQNPSNDERVASDTASRNGDRYEWNTGNTGLSGKFYARVARTDECKGDTSQTVRSDR